MAQNSKQQVPERTECSRRRFMKGAGAAALSFSIVKPEHVRGSQANSKVTLGIIGCGGRGVWIASLFQKHGGYQILAGADYFQERANSLNTRQQVHPSRLYTGLSGYKRLLESKVDAVAIESPPYFHPLHAADAVDAGAHVYLCKPIAVDVWGCRSVEESARKAAAKKLCFIVDFQTRNDPLYLEAIRRARSGVIGEMICGAVSYVAGSPWTNQLKYLEPDPNDSERRIRAWGLDKALSGDIITEQNIHALDVATWILDQAPVRAYGTGGRKSRSIGSCWDHFSVIFTFPKDLVMTFHSKQYGRGADDISACVYGSEGFLDTHYTGEVFIRGKEPYEGGKVDNVFTNGAIRNIAAFHKSITEGDYSQPTVAPSVRSNLTTIVGRTAAYRGQEVTWDDVMKAGEKLDPALKGLKD